MNNGKAHGCYLPKGDDNHGLFVFYLNLAHKILKYIYMSEILMVRIFDILTKSKIQVFNIRW